MSEFEKKSERIEIRVSHSKKQAFNEACEQGGDTPSGALRRFIDGYIRRADNDALKDGLRAMGRMARRRWLPLSAAAAALLLGGYFTGQALKPTPQDGPIVTASTDDFPPIDYSLFAAYDKNANGVLDLGEVAENDEHLHRVLNLDGEAGISPAEFYVKAIAQWSMMEEEKVSLNEDNNSVNFIHSWPIHIVRFDLTEPTDVMLDVESRETPLTDVRFERIVGWRDGEATPKFTMNAYDFPTRNIPSKELKSLN